jgi:DNA topoisomerase-1
MDLDRTQPDHREAAQMAGLRYVRDDLPGYRRVRRGKGFSYLDPQGKVVHDPRERARFQALAIPPAWTEVWISMDPNGHIQATGRDARGRKQYIYHPLWEEARKESKFHRLVPFGAALPEIRAQVEEDLRARKLTLQKVTALVVKLLDETLIRIGNREYARQNQSYGLTTLEMEHVDISGSQIVFQFRGKSGKEQRVRLRDRRLVNLVKRCEELPGQQIFKYLDEEGNCCQAVNSEDVNRYLREVSGQEFSAKDFRTWGGTTLAAVELYETGPAGTEKEAKKNITAAIKRVALALGNTPSVCRQYYVHPAVLEAYLDGSLFERMQAALLDTENRRRLDPHEAAVMALIRDWEKARA